MNEVRYVRCGSGLRCDADGRGLQLPINVIGVLAGCENMPGGVPIVRAMC